MKNNIKRLTLALITLGLSAPVLAASSPFCVTVPNQQGGFTVGGDILWLRPSVPNSTYNATVDLGPAGTNPFNVNVNLQNVNPSYKWGFDLMAAYRIPCTGNDITVVWTHLSSASNTNTATKTYDITSIVRIPSSLTVDSSSTTSFKYDAVDLDLGQRVNFGDYFDFRMFAGLRGVTLEQNRNNNYAFTIASPIPIFGPGPQLELALSQNSKFRGIGPQMGLEGRYCLGYGFGIDASTILSAVVGRVDSNATVSVLDNLPPPTTVNVNLNTERKTRVVPAVDLNLGADYTFNFNNCSRSSLVIQAGYKVIHYWDVSHMFVSNIGPNNANSVSFDGPYLGLKVNV